MTINISKLIKIKYTVIFVFHVDVQKSTETQKDMIINSELRQGNSLCWKNALHFKFSCHPQDGNTYNHEPLTSSL